MAVLEAMKMQNSLVAANNKLKDWNKSLELLFQSLKTKMWQC